MLDRGLEPILSLGHLAHLTGLSYRFLRGVASRDRDAYLDLVQRKRDGSSRPISSPEPPLMDVQRWILRSVLGNIDNHSASYAYVKGRSIQQCAQQHVGTKWLVKLDLHNFFGSIDESQVFHTFHRMGYPRLISFELARICTRLDSRAPRIRNQSKQYTQIPSYSDHLRGHLPQGAPTSGALANAAAFGLDTRLAAIANDNDCVYTRYSDDLTFSPVGDFDRKAASKLIARVETAIRLEHFDVHHKKTRVVPPGARHVVLGLMVQNDRVRLLPEFRRKLDVHIRGVDKHGLVEHAGHRGFRSIFSFINHVDGCLAFSSSIEPLFTTDARMRWNAALTKHGYPSEPGG